MLQIQELHYSIGDRDLLSGVNWAVPQGRRCALIGPNGAGKTTLLRIIIGKISPSQGRIVKPKAYRIGYLPQEEISLELGTVLEAVLGGRRDLLDMQSEIAGYHAALDSTSSPSEELLEKLGDLENLFSGAGGYELEPRAKAILSGLGFSPAELDRPVHELSGGWRMRAYLGRLLLQQPDLLLLDEPTNHLDLPSLEWLEQYLLDFKGGLVIVSHDRYFIDRLAQEIFELEHGVLQRFPGNYHFYEKKKEDQRILQQKRWEEQQDEIKRQERFIERFRYKSTKAAQVQSRIKQLEKMIKIEPPVQRRRLSFNLDVQVKSYKDVVEIRDMSFGYQSENILENLHLHICRGERAALVGANGEGKTTLTRLIVGELKHRTGDLRIGTRTRIGYYAQHQVEAMNLEASIYDEVASTVSENMIPRIRDVLGIFQFSGDDVLKKIKVLSGGEKARVSLAKILLSPINFLIMDEPTNHLDLPSREALEAALSGFNGTLLVISHDRYFLDKLIGRVIEVKGGRLWEYAGNYSYYLEKRNEISTLQPECPEEKKEEREKFKSKDQKRKEAEARQAVSRERNRLETEIRSLEDRIDFLETKKSEIDLDMCCPEIHKNGKKMRELQIGIADVRKELEMSYHSWEECRNQLEELLSDLKKS